MKRERSPVCVGDRVRVEAGVVVGRAERRSVLLRPAPNSREMLLHALAANLDFLVVVASARQPDFSPGIVDRFLVAASSQKIPAVVCVNKADLFEAGAPRLWSAYPGALEVSASTGALGALPGLVAGKTTAFCGNSGVGKTSLLRRLLGDEAYGRVGAISGSTGKGRHTTTGALLLAGPAGASFIDTPGVMNFGLVGVTKANLLAHFPELAVAAKACAAGCAHDGAACALSGLPRHAGYLQLRAGLA